MKTRRTRSLTSNKYVEKRRKKFILTISLISLATIIFIIACIYVIRLPFLRITDIQIQGSSLPVENDVKKILAGDYGYIVPRSNFLFYPRQTIIKDLKMKYPQILDVSTRIQGLNTLSVIITLRGAAITVCDGFKGDENNTCYVADMNGYVFGQTEATSTFMYYISGNATSTLIGTYFIPTERFIDLKKLVTDAKSVGMQPTGLLVSSDGSYELYIKNRREGEAVVYFDDRIAFDAIVSNLITFWNNVLAKKIGLNTVPDFDYINLRFGNNVFYFIKDNGGNRESN